MLKACFSSSLTLGSPASQDYQRLRLSARPLGRVCNYQTLSVVASTFDPPKTGIRGMAKAILFLSL